MVGHAFGIDECPHNLHVANVQDILALHQLFHGSISRQHVDLQQEFGREHTPYSTGPSNPAKTQIVCQI